MGFFQSIGVSFFLFVGSSSIAQTVPIAASMRGYLGLEGTIRLPSNDLFGSAPILNVSEPTRCDGNHENADFGEQGPTGRDPSKTRPMLISRLPRKQVI